MACCALVHGMQWIYALLGFACGSVLISRVGLRPEGCPSWPRHELACWLRRRSIRSDLPQVLPSALQNSLEYSGVSPRLFSSLLASRLLDSCISVLEMSRPCSGFFSERLRTGGAALRHLEEMPRPGGLWVLVALLCRCPKCCQRCLKLQKHGVALLSQGPSDASTSRAARPLTGGLSLQSSGKRGGGGIGGHWGALDRLGHQCKVRPSPARMWNS